MAYIDLGAQEATKQAPAQKGGPAPKGEEAGSTQFLASPLVSSALTGLGIWRIARSMDVHPRRAAQTGFVVFGLGVYAKLLQGYLKAKAEEMKRGTP